MGNGSFLPNLPSPPPPTSQKYKAYPTYLSHIEFDLLLLSHPVIHCHANNFFLRGCDGGVFLLGEGEGGVVKEGV